MSNHRLLNVRFGDVVESGCRFRSSLITLRTKYDSTTLKPRLRVSRAEIRRVVFPTVAYRSRYGCVLFDIYVFAATGGRQEAHPAHGLASPGPVAAVPRVSPGFTDVTEARATDWNRGATATSTHPYAIEGDSESFRRPRPVTASPPPGACGFRLAAEEPRSCERRRVANAIRNSIDLLEDRLMGPFNAEQAKNFHHLSE